MVDNGTDRQVRGKDVTSKRKQKERGDSVRRTRDPYKVDMLVKILQEMEEDEWFLPQVTSSGKRDKGIKSINLDKDAVRTLINYYGG